MERSRHPDYRSRVPAAIPRLSRAPTPITPPNTAACKDGSYKLLLARAHEWWAKPKPPGMVGSMTILAIAKHQILYAGPQKSRQIPRAIVSPT